MDTYMYLINELDKSFKANKSHLEVEITGSQPNQGNRNLITWYNNNIDDAKAVDQFLYYLEQKDMKYHIELTAVQRDSAGVLWGGNTLIITCNLK